MKRTLLMSLLLLLTLVGQSWAQSRSVSGRVLDKSTNEGLPGVSVIVKGTNTGTATDADGRFTVTVTNSTTVLQFKYLGYLTTEQAVGSSDKVDVAMAVDNKQLDEVTVTALGISREKRALGYAVSEVKSEQVVQKSEPDILRTLTGKVPGVNIVSSSGVPGASSRITIRGNTSFYGENQPLFVVDGVPYDNSQTESDNPITNGASYSSRTADVDPNNIASINVLKGAAAAALYGSRAAGGVIVITTKTGGGGQRGPKGIQIGYTTGYSMEKIAGLPDYQNKYGAGANFVNSSANGSWGPEFGNHDQGAPDSIAHPQAGDPNFPNIPLGTKIPYKAYPNNVKDFFKTGHVFENSVSLNSTSDNATFTTILSRADQQGIIPNSSFVRNNISTGGSGKFNKFTISGNVAYTNTNQQGPLGGANNLLAGSASAFSRTLFLTRSLDLQGLPYIDPVTHASTFAWLSRQADNPLWSVENAIYTSRVDRVVGSVGLSYAIKDWLTVTYTGGFNTYTDSRRTTIRPGSNANFRISSVLEDNLQNLEMEQTLLLNFNKNITEDLSLTASVGQNINARKFDGRSNIGYGIVTFGIDNIENTKEKSTYGYAYSERRLMGLLGNATLGYKNFAFLTLTGRNDFSSTLNKDGVIGNTGRSFFYSSAAASLVLNEALKLDYRWLDLAKLRVAYGRVGRDAPAYRSGPTTYYIPSGSFPFLGQPGVSISSTINNPGLTPEFTNELELGAELALFRNRISFNGTYYNRRSTQLIAPRILPAATGYSDYWTNFGAIKNEGTEIALTVVPVETSGFRWSSTFNFTLNRNIVKQTLDGDTLTLGGAFNLLSLLIPGQPYGVLYGTTPKRTEDGQLLVDPVSGRLVPGGNKIIGNPNPDFIMGFINQFTYKGFTLNTLIDYRKGGSIYSTTLQEELGRGVTKDTEDRNRLVIIDGVRYNPVTKGPATDTNGNFIRNTTAISLNDYYFSSAGVGGGAATNGYNEQSMYDATTVRLREVTLGYDLPKSILGKTPFSVVNISVSGRNLYWYSPNLPKHSNFDPETNTFGSSNVQGIELTNAPNTRRYGVNLRVTF
ncbi:SusC/RagA family TonB-linked outer membrane protein [Hymenobacter properus]|uniref:SusC/RagA family TonB-linked outer membrane protein n=1 Tax=Hymenobacter properus TaxID=2791026 RepID=A0A931BGZ6_9BACT|nr:SusC/RagA family TonB-linked outer membrane protein [Hymenobacter properus]MBF9142127.1 SusC/RagA family TonB-linked outer membrane protein [Hymenobacter properus]MBR7720934.1 SusC/RagA family TonB-linked outer membrane protein [Microvirga sp. SRT04]